MKLPKKKEIAVSGPLGGASEKAVTASPIDGSRTAVDLSQEKKPDYSPENTKKELEKHGLAASETVEVVNPVTGKRSIVTIERDGTHESKLIMALADPKLNRDQKDNMLGLYLFERGKENASFLMDLFRFKGQHTKDTNAFKSQMRFDFEMFVQLFTKHLRKVADDVFRECGIKDPIAFMHDYVAFLKEKEKEGEIGTVHDFIKTRGEVRSPAECAIIAVAMRDFETSDYMARTVEKVAENRMRQKGYGIYIAKNGSPYSIFDDNDIVDVVKQDIERIRNLSEEDQHEQRQ